MAKDLSYQILHVIGSLKGGAAIHLSHLTHAFLRKGHICTIASPQDNASLKMLMDASGNLFHDIPMESSPWRSIKMLRQIISRHSYSHIHVHGHRAAYITRKALLKLHPPVIYTVHGYHPPFYKTAYSRWLANRAEKMLEPKTDVYIAVSESTRKNLVDHVPKADDKCRVILNAIPRERISADEAQGMRKTVRRELQISPERQVIGTVARLQWQKGVDRLLVAHQELIQEGSKHLLLIVGDGPDRKILEDYCQKNRLTEHVRFLGNRIEARRLFYAMDAFALASHWEGLPLTVLEAWDAGTPVIVPNVPGCCDLVQNHYNGLCVTNDTQGLAGGMRFMLNHPEQAYEMVVAGWQTFDEEYKLDNMIQQTETIYQSLVRRPSIQSY